jgi:uncharacterized membrane protein YhaH (DUF805 family)
MNFETLKKNVEQAVRIGFSKFADFSGRSSRPEYWYFMLPIIVLMFVTNLVDSILLGGMPALSLIVALATLVPTLSASARRLHDTNRSGWWLLVALVPVVGAFVVIYLCCQPGTEGPNNFGPEPSPANFGVLAQA